MDFCSRQATDRNDTLAIVDEKSTDKVKPIEKDMPDVL